MVICSLVESLLEESLGVIAWVAKVGRGGMATVPHKMRRIPGIKEEGSIQWVYEDGKITVRKYGG